MSSSSQDEDAAKLGYFSGNKAMDDENKIADGVAPKVNHGLRMRKNRNR